MCSIGTVSCHAPHGRKFKFVCNLNGKFPNFSVSCLKLPKILRCGHFSPNSSVTRLPGYSFFAMGLFNSFGQSIHRNEPDSDATGIYCGEALADILGCLSHWQYVIFTMLPYLKTLVPRKNGVESFAMCFYTKKRPEISSILSKTLGTCLFSTTSCCKFPFLPVQSTFILCILWRYSLNRDSWFTAGFLRSAIMPYPLKASIIRFLISSKVFEKLVFKLKIIPKLLFLEIFEKKKTKFYFLIVRITNEM